MKLLLCLDVWSTLARCPPMSMHHDERTHLHKSFETRLGKNTRPQEMGRSRVRIISHSYS